MKRIQLSITNKPRTDGHATFPDFITDCYHTGLYDQSCGEFVYADPVEILVFYGEEEASLVELVNSNNLYDEKVEFRVTEISDAEWKEIKAAMDEYDDDKEFFARLRSKYPH